jgi:DNA polymerase-3 subunit chi
MLILVDGVVPRSRRLQPLRRSVRGNDPAAVEAARQRWRRAQAGGHTLTYWQQTEAGWEKKA